LASLIPSLPDDPKARFLDDLVSEGAEDPRRHNLLKKPEGDSSSSVPESSPGKKGKDPHRNRVKAEGEAERRFTQATLERVSVAEYWERMGFRQECISGDVTGFFTLESSPPPATTTTSSSTPMISSSPDPKTPSTALPHAIVDRILSALLNTDFKSFETSLDHSGLWESQVRALVSDEIGEEGYSQCIGKVEGRAGEVVAPKRKEEVVVTMLQPRKKKKV
jgi:regulator of Ty1 transposition protein 109